MLGHNMGILRSYEILRKVQKHLGGLGHALSVYETQILCDIHSDTASFDFKIV